MRPSVKGGEVFIERVGLEEKIAGRNADIISLLNKEKIVEAIDKLDERMAEAEAKSAPAAMTAPGREEFMDWTMLRATLLVNSSRDEEAVDGLLAAAKKMPKAEQIECYSSAAVWAVLHDMEVRFFRMHLKEYPDLDGAKEKASAKEILSKVINAVKADDEMEDHVVQAVLSKEIATIVARAQNSQEFEDRVEDPMGTSVVRDSVAYYKDTLGGRFWEKFYHLSMAPPLSPKSNPPNRPPEETPQHVLDSIGRSMLLHHIAKLYAADDGPLPGETGDGLLNVDLEKLNALPKVQRVTLKRMQELLKIVKQHGLDPTGTGKAEKANHPVR
jgi:hypothetical protein